MPKLLDFTALGQRETGRTGRPAASVNLTEDKAAFAGIGNSIARVGDTVQGFVNQQQADDTRISTANATANMLKKQNEFLENVRNNPDDFPNWEKQFDQHIAQARQESAGLISDPRQRKLWDAQQGTVVENWRSGIKKQAFDRQRDSYMGQTQTDIEELRRIALDPNTPEGDKALHIETAANMIEDARRRGFISDQTARDWSQRWREGYAVSKMEMLSPSERLQRLQSAHGVTQSGLVPPVDGTFAGGPKSVYGAARGPTRAHAGVDWQAENGTPARSAIGGKVVYVGSHSGYGNTVDVLGSDGNVHRYALHEGGVQVKIGDAVTAGQQIGTVGGRHVHNEIIRNGSQAWRLSTSGQFGATSRQGDRDDQTLDPMAVYGLKPGARVNGSSSQPAGSLGAYREESGGAPLQMATPDPIASLIPPDKRQQMIERAKLEDERDRRQEGLTVQQLIQDDQNSLLATGIGAKSLTYDRVANALGKERADIWQQGRVAAFETFQNTRGMEEMTDDQLRVHAQKFQPSETDAGEGFTQKLQIYQNVEKRAQDILKQRAEDPAAAVENTPSVQAARQSLQGDNSVGAREAFIFTRMQQQELLGVPKSLQSPITVAEAKTYASKMRPLARGQADAANQDQVIQGIIQEIEQSYGKYAPDVLKQVLYHVTLKRDAADVLSNAITRMRTTDAGPLVTEEENRRLTQGEQARTITQMAGEDPFDGQGFPYGAPPEPTYPMPNLKAMQLLESDPQKYLGAFVQKYGIKSVPKSLRFGPQIDEMTAPQPKAKR